MSRPLLIASLAILLALAFAIPAIAAPLELDELRQQYEKLVAERVTTPYETALTELNTKFTTALDSASAAAKQAGKLDEVLAFQGDAKLIANKQRMPAEDPEGTPEALKKLRAIYREQSGKIEDDRNSNAATIDGPFLAKLEELEVSLTRADRIEDATKVREFRGTLETPPTKGPLMAEKPVASVGAPIGAADSTFAGGRLFAVGKIGPPPGVEIDLTPAEGISDFIDVTGNKFAWVALRRDGTAIGWHSQSGPFSRPGFKKILGYNGLGGVQPMGISNAGNLVTLTTGERVNDIGDVTDAASSLYHGLALLEDGTVKVWGAIYEGPVGGNASFPSPPEASLKDVAKVGVSRYNAWLVGRDGSFKGWGSGKIHDLPSELRGGIDLWGYAWGFFASTKRKEFYQWSTFARSSAKSIKELPDQVRAGDEAVIQLSRNRWSFLQLIYPELHNERATLETLNDGDLPFFYQEVVQDKTATSYLLWLSADDPR